MSAPARLAASPAAGAPGGRPVPFHGLIAIDKPAGVTSHDVAEEVGRRLGIPGPGHLGTLDPPATGLLVIALGAATRCAPVWQGGEKTYEGRLRLGLVTDTQDLAGRVLEQHPVRSSEEELRAAGAALVGEIDQIPPMVSARRVGGERLYRIARRGEVVEREARKVRVISWEWGAVALPDAEFRVRCSGGTYVRTLVHDLGQRLGCGAALASLRRLRSEPFGLERALTLRALAALPAHEAWSGYGIPLAQALATLPQVTLDEAGAEALGHGGGAKVPEAAAAGVPVGAGPRSVVIRGPDGTPLALGELERAGTAFQARPHVVFPWAVRQGRG